MLNQIKKMGKVVFYALLIFSFWTGGRCVVTAEELGVEPAARAAGITEDILVKVEKLLKDPSWLSRNSVGHIPEPRRNAALVKAAFSDVMMLMEKYSSATAYVVDHMGVFVAKYFPKSAVKPVLKAGLRSVGSLASQLPIIGIVIGGFLYMVPCWWDNGSMKKTVECTFYNATDVGSAR